MKLKAISRIYILYTSYYYVEKLILNIIEEKEEAKSMSGTYPNDSLFLINDGMIFIINIWLFLFVIEKTYAQYSKCNFKNIYIKLK